VALGIERGGFAGEAVAWRRDSRDLVAFVGCFGVASPICVNRPFGTYDNVARARAEGVEVSLSARPVEGLRAGATWSYVRAVDRGTGRDLPRRARQSASASLDWTGGRFGGGATVTAVGASFDDAANRVRLGGYALLDLRASVDLGGGVEAFGRIENAGDERYETAAGYGQPGRAAFAGVRVRR
jgi:vitamin B12 transporter